MFVRKLKVKLNRSYLRLVALYNYIIDYNNHIKHCVYYHDESNLSKDMMRCRIMLLYHQLEKAQTYSIMKKDYGKEKIVELLRLSQIYFSRYGSDSVLLTSMGVINSHISNPYSYKDEVIKNKFNLLLNNIGISSDKLQRGGVVLKTLNDIPHDNSLLAFLKSRRSLRRYSNEKLTKEEIRTAIEYAMTAPSACNRQSVRAHYYDDPQIIKDIIISQKSDINWCLDAKGLFIITGNRSLFRDYFERNQYMFDAGLFSMNLVLGLHNQGIGSCFKMAQKDKRIDQNTKKIAGIPSQEDICVLLLIGKYPHDEIVCAKSSRLDIEEVLISH